MARFTKGSSKMTNVVFLGGPWHGKQQNLDRGSRPMILVKSQAGQRKAAVYVYHSPTEYYVFGSYVSNQQVAA